MNQRQDTLKLLENNQHLVKRIITLDIEWLLLWILVTKRIVFLISCCKASWQNIIVIKVLCETITYNNRFENGFIIHKFYLVDYALDMVHYLK